MSCNIVSYYKYNADIYIYMLLCIYFLYNIYINVYNVYMYIYMYVYIYVCMYMCVCIYVCVFNVLYCTTL